MPRSVLQVLVLLVVLAPVALPNAAAGPSAQARASRAWTSPRFGFVVDVPAHGLQARLEPAPAEAEPQQIQESLVLLRQRVEVVRLDVFTNPAKRSVQAWFDAEFAGLKTKDSRLEPAVATPQRTPALRLLQTNQGQTWPRQLVFFAVDDLLLVATCERADDKAALQALDQIVASLRPGNRRSR